MMIPMMGNKGCEEGTKWEHEPVAKTTDCGECHEGMSRATKPANHDIAWTKEHGSLVQRYGNRATNYCQLCHSESTCTSCHQQNAPADHTNFFRLRGHGLNLGMDRERCATCHMTESCERCHSETKPLSHNAGWGSATNRHCQNCHFPPESIGAQECNVCHKSPAVHPNTPKQPNNNKHLTGADCLSCHAPLRHPDNGQACTVCHTK